MIRVAVADDQHLVRDGVRSLLGAEPGVQLVAEASTGPGVLQVVAQLAEAGGPPDVVLLDVRLAGLDGIEVTRRITATPEWRDVAVIMLTTFEYDDHVIAALQAGARAFLLKDGPPGVLVEAVRTVAAGGAMLTPLAARLVVEHLSAQADPWRTSHPSLARVREGLGHRDRIVLGYVASGLTDAEIARRLRVFPVAAAARVQGLMERLGARHRAELVVAAYEAGIVRPQGA